MNRLSLHFYLFIILVISDKVEELVRLVMSVKAYRKVLLQTNGNSGKRTLRVGAFWGSQPTRHQMENPKPTKTVGFQEFIPSVLSEKNSRNSTVRLFSNPSKMGEIS